MATLNIQKLVAAPERISHVVPDAPCQLDSKLCTATYTVSSMAVDNDGDILVPEGSIPHLERYRNNPVVLWDHNNHMAPIAQSINPATKSLSWDVYDQNCVKATALFHMMTQESAQCWALVEASVLRGSSVGYDPVTGKSLRLAGRGIKFLEWAPHEWSIVPVPCNPEALLDTVHRHWDGKSLAPSIVKSMMRYAPPNPTARVVVPMVLSKRYVKNAVPWAVQSSNKLATSSKESKAMADEQLATDEAVEPVQHPPGAQAVMGFCADLEAALANLHAALPMIEKEPILELFESVGMAIGEQVDVLKAKLAEVYPDLKVEAEDEEEEAEEVGEAEDVEPAEKVNDEEEPADDPAEEVKAEDDVEEEEDKPKEKSKVKSLSKSDYAPHLQSVQDAGELVKEMGDSPNIPKSYRLACKSAYSGLASACDYMTKTFAITPEGKVEEQKADEPEPEPVEKADDEISEDEMKAIKSLQADLASLRKETSKIAGKVK